MEKKQTFYLHPVFRLISLFYRLFLYILQFIIIFLNSIPNKWNLTFTFVFIFLGIFIRGVFIRYEYDDTGVSIKIITQQIKRMLYLEITTIKSIWYFIPIYVINYFQKVPIHVFT